MRRKGSLTAILLTLLVVAEPLMAFSFCFSFGSKSHNRPHYSTYPPPYPGVAAPGYPVYGYSPVPPPNGYNNIYYPPPSPYVTVPPESIKE